GPDAGQWGMIRIILATLIVCLACPVWAQSSYQSRSRQPAVNQLWLPAHRGDPNAQYDLGLLYGSGNGIAKNLTEAAKWYRRAADQGHARAQAMLGVLFNSGQGVPRSQIEAIKWWRRAAQQGNADARFNLGMAYWKGEGVTQDFDKAAALFRSMAPAGSSYARSVLGTRSVPQSTNPRTDPKPRTGSTRLTEPALPLAPGTNFETYLSAARAGDANAQSQVGYMYAVGLGVARDLVEAHKWTNIAAALLPAGRIRQSSIGNRNAAAAQMSPEQILKAQRLARDWLAAFDKQQRR
ncbi:MAG: tetratricopeptide repeat protein, partial [Alphaproteobacteria bacterium]